MRLKLGAQHALGRIHEVPKREIGLLSMQVVPITPVIEGHCVTACLREHAALMHRVLMLVVLEDRPFMISHVEQGFEDTNLITNIHLPSPRKQA